MMRKSYRSWLIVLALAGAAIDQVSKYGIFAWMYEHPTRFSGDAGTCEIVPGAFKLYAQFSDKPAGDSWLYWGSKRLPRVNHGALFGLMNQHEREANRVFAVISVVAGIAIIGWSFRRNTAADRLLCAALGLILAGTLGNLFDRVVFGGVRDFLYFYWIDWPVFNIADCCLVCGAFLLLAQAFLTHPAKAPVQIVHQSVPSPEVAKAQV